MSASVPPPEAVADPSVAVSAATGNVLAFGAGGGEEAVAAGGSEPAARVVTSAEELMGDAMAAATVFEHCAHFPPHGPYAHLSAVALAAVLAQRHAIVVAPPLLVSIFTAYFRVDHLREWPSLYVAAELRLTDVDSL